MLLKRFDDPSIECRMLQNHLTVLQMYKTISLKKVEEKSNIGSEQSL
jgi:hypothetical protein